jgi:alanyl-tRNA synthetase
LLGASADSPAVVFAQSSGLPFDMGALMKEALAKLGGRGGGSRDMSQGGPSQIAGVEAELNEIAVRLKNQQKP